MSPRKSNAVPGRNSVLMEQRIVASTTTLGHPSMLPSLPGLCSCRQANFQEHFLRAMYILANYPTTQVGCAAAGTAKKGAVDPKTWLKYIWPWIYFLADMEDDVVSSVVCFNVVSSHNSPYAFRSFSRTGESILQVIRILALIARIAASLRRVGSLRPLSSKGSRQCVTRWLWES